MTVSNLLFPPLAGRILRELCYEPFRWRSADGLVFRVGGAVRILAQDVGDEVKMLKSMKLSLLIPICILFTIL